MNKALRLFILKRRLDSTRSLITYDQISTVDAGKLIGKGQSSHSKVLYCIRKYYLGSTRFATVDLGFYVKTETSPLPRDLLEFFSTSSGCLS